MIFNYDKVVTYPPTFMLEPIPFEDPPPPCARPAQFEIVPAAVAAQRFMEYVNKSQKE